MWAAKSGLQRGCRPLPLPVSQSWHRCAGGRGSAPGLAGWSCPHGPQRSHTAALGASSRLASPPGSAGRARGGEHSPTCTSAPTQGAGWGMSPSIPHQCGHATATAAWQSSSRSANILTLSRRPICKVFFPFFAFFWCICTMFMLMAFISLQGGKPHPWFSRCTPLHAALLPPLLLSPKAPPTCSMA